MFVFIMFLIRSPLILRFENTTLFFANGEGGIFSTYMKQEVSFRASSDDHDPDWRSRRAHGIQSKRNGIEIHSSVLFSGLLYFSAMCLYSSNLAF